MTSVKAGKAHEETGKTDMLFSMLAIGATSQYGNYLVVQCYWSVQIYFKSLFSLLLSTQLEPSTRSSKTCRK